VRLLVLGGTRILGRAGWDADREWPRAEGVGLAPERERGLLAAV